MGRIFDSGRGMEGSGHVMSEQDDIDSDFPPHDEDTLISVDENDEPDEIYYSSQSGRPGQEKIFNIGDESDGESIEEYYSGSDRDEEAGYNEDYGHKYHPAHEGDESDSSPTSVTAPVRESGSSKELEVHKKEKKSKSFLKKIFGGSKKNLTGGMFKKKRISELSDGDIERSESADEQGTSGKSSIPFPDESNKSYDISVVSELSMANKDNKDDGSESQGSYNIEVIDSPGAVKVGNIWGHSTKHKQEVRRTSFEKQCPGVAEGTEEDEGMIEDAYEYKTYQIRLPEYPEDTNAKRAPELTPDTPEFKKKKNKKKEKKVHASALASRSPGASSRVDYTGQIASTSHNPSIKLQNEIHRLKTLVELMMTRMELYERQSECLVEASVEHDRQWKLASIENFKAASQKPDKQSAMDEQLSNIKALLIERSIQDKWIRKLEDIQRGYEQRLAETQTQLKTVRKEHIKTNKAIVNLKRSGGEILTESSRTDQTPEDMIEDSTKDVTEMETPVARNVPLQRWTSNRDTSNKSQSELHSSTNPIDASKHSMQSLEPDGRIVKTTLLEEMIVSWHTDVTDIDARDMSPLSVRGDKKKKKKKDKKKKKSKSSKSVKSLDVNSKSVKSFALE